MIKAVNSSVTTEVKFEKLASVGSGNFATVYKIRDIQLDVTRAAKEISASQFSKHEEYYEEARQMSTAGHPNVVPVHFCGLAKNGSDDCVYIVMDYYSRGSLEALHQERQLRVEEIVRYMLQFLTGLAFIHSRDIAHLDLKPSNILIKGDGVAAITDFGIAKWLDEYGTAESNRFYKKHLPPEYVTNRKVTSHTDIYHAGLTLYRLCNAPGELQQQYVSLDSTSIGSAILNEDYPDRSQFLPHIPERLRRVVRKATAVDPNDRYDTVRDMINDISRTNQYLSWQMQRGDGSTHNWIWTRESDKRTVRIEIIPNGDKWNVETTKTVSATQRCRDSCESGFGALKKAFAFVQTRIRKDSF